MKRELTKEQQQQQMITTTYSRSIWRPFIKAVEKYDLIHDGDSIAVCISGGKDSMLLAKLLSMAEQYRLWNITVKYLMMDPGYSKEHLQNVADNAAQFGIPLQVFATNIFADTDAIGKNPCFFCSRMRRGFLYRKAKELGCNKIALGHHYNDVVETILMGMLYGAQVQTMLPILQSDNVAGMELIRPLYLVHEADIIRWKDQLGMQFVKCACHVNHNGEQEETARWRVKQLLAMLSKENASIEENIFGSVENVNLRKIMGYQLDGKHYDYAHPIHSKNMDERTMQKDKDD